eukprot:4145444-Pyramimonas_sp.AAC.1
MCIRDSLRKTRNIFSIYGRSDLNAQAMSVGQWPCMEFMRSYDPGADLQAMRLAVRIDQVDDRLTGWRVSTP